MIGGLNSDAGQGTGCNYPSQRLNKSAEMKIWNENINVLYIFARIAPVV